MRLWHEALLPYLPRQQLLGQHREVCALRGKGWGRNHSIVNHVFKHPHEWLYQYHMRVMAEMERRGYRPDPSWKDGKYRGTSCPPLEEFNDSLAIVGTPVYPEHNAEYLEECVQNLESKGINLREQVKPSNQ